MESVAQFRFLQDHHCAHCQGFLIGRALPASEAALLLERGREPFDGTPTARLRHLSRAEG